ncbi:rhodanese-like domain-containing protein [Shewanella sp. AS1]|uniref:rhodanese-like domain-containing protein n=1 Tax=Shewanella sp. AS1 TaxID=2907626 RepID=UPI001F204A69|nr:rhodanese-like domain-containing protein [Shewanella sp. AS1]MCE9678298.1 rhodanese-like domain-containing protein [Shewanella sp. AS1]
MTSLLNRIISLSTLLFIAVISLNQSALAHDKTTDVTWQLIQNGALVVDVRTPEEFNQGHLDNAINIPYESIADAFTKQNIAKDRNVVVYCRSGRRSGIAQESLIKLGYQHVHNGGGYQQLMAEK